MDSNCPYSDAVIQTVATELHVREMRARPSLLSHDAGVLLDLLTDRGLDYLAPTEWLANNHSVGGAPPLWLLWLVQSSVANVRRRMKAGGPWHRGTTNAMCGILSDWLQTGHSTGPLEMIGTPVPSDLYYLLRIIRGDGKAFYETSGWSTWRIFPMLGRIHDPNAPVPCR